MTLALSINTGAKTASYIFNLNKLQQSLWCPYCQLITNIQLREFYLFQYIIMSQNVISQSEHKFASEHLRRNKQKMSTENHRRRTNYFTGQYAMS